MSTCETAQFGITREELETIWTEANRQIRETGKLIARNGYAGVNYYISTLRELSKKLDEIEQFADEQGWEVYLVCRSFEPAALIKRKKHSEGSNERGVSFGEIRKKEA